MDKIYNYFDLTLANNIKCENREENEVNNFYDMIKNKSLIKNKKIGFPSTINISKEKNLNNTKNLQQYIFNNLKGIDKENNISNFETIIEFIPDEKDNNKIKGELKINLNKNKLLSEERKKISENQKNDKKKENGKKKDRNPQIHISNNNFNMHRPYNSNIFALANNSEEASIT